MNYDIEYLLFLQNFRNSINNALTPFMEWVSMFAITYLLLFPVFIYWAIDKKKGYFTMAVYSIVSAINAIVKLCACVYRPWIRDARVVPAGDSIRTATGYSFPSGHTICASTLYGGMGTTERKDHPWITAICVFMILLTGFSRNYLGVHTPQDVFVAIFESVLIIILVGKLFDYLEKNPEKENYFLIGGVIFGILALVFITFKPYPLTYVDGKLLVDPQVMMNDGYGDIARLIFFCIARYVEREWIRFKPASLKNAKGIITTIIGLIILALMLNYMKAPLDNLLGSHWGHFCNNAIRMFFIIAGYPFIIKKVCNEKE